MQSKILEEKYQAIDKFKERLLGSLIGDRIAKIILFGSVLKGEAREESDIDFSVIVIDHLEKVGDICSEIPKDKGW